jgi:mono/diheme cytochrome c family protein
MVALAVSIALNVVVRRPKGRLGFEYFPNMVRTARYNTFEANPNFPDGMTLRPPVRGTIPRGLAPLPPVGDAGGELTNPFSPEDRAAVARGAVVFANFCELCHGANGVGQGPVVKHGFPGPPSLLRAEVQRMSDAELFGVLTSGQNSMPSYASQISREDRWKSILFVRSLGQQGPPHAGGAAQ